jgi:type IV pilus assembly protein PilM
MAFGFARNRLSPIAIDPGADQLKLLQIAGGEQPQVTAMAAEPVPQEARGDAEARHQFIEQALPRLLHDGGFRGRRAMCTIPAFSTYIHHLDITANEKVSREEQINTQLRERLNIEPTRMVVRTFDVGPVQRESGLVQRVMALAAKRDKVMKYVELARHCRLEVVGMHSEPLCVVRAFAHRFRRETDHQRACCFIDLGATTTKVTIAHGQEMIFTKTIQAGGEQAIHALAKERSLSFERARALHLAQADAPDAHQPAHSDTKATPPSGEASQPQASAESALATAPLESATGPAEPTNARDDAFETIIDELRLCLRYHQRLFADRPVDSLVFIGGGAHHRQHGQAIAKALGLSATIGDPLAPGAADPRATILGVDPSVPQPGWAVPVGLSQSEANL